MAIQQYVPIYLHLKNYILYQHLWNILENDIYQSISIQCWQKKKWRVLIGKINYDDMTVDKNKNISIPGYWIFYRIFNVY